MSQQSLLKAYIQARFAEAFGQPNHAPGEDLHWSLQPSAKAIPINVLVNGRDEKPAIWIVDPHDHSDGVVKTFVAQEQEIASIIAQIQERLRRAARSAGGSAPSAPPV